ncbi:MAG: winged helix-turn-helix transcriptional regulator [Nitrospinae bacterium]|nr:winged helix-turn-helix transcriptional regulator [Nitrospinota bacterium]
MRSMAAIDGPAERCARAVMETVPLVTRFIRAEMRARWAPSLSVPQFHVLALLNREPGSSLSNVADQLGVTRSTASVIVDRLVRRKLVRRTEDPQERRCVVLSLTATGTQHFVQARDASRKQMASVLGKLSPADFRHITDGLNLLGSAFKDLMPWRSS